MCSFSNYSGACQHEHFILNWQVGKIKHESESLLAYHDANWVCICWNQWNQWNKPSIEGELVWHYSSIIKVILTELCFRSRGLPWFQWHDFSKECLKHICSRSNLCLSHFISVQSMVWQNCVLTWNFPWYINKLASMQSIKNRRKNTLQPFKRALPLQKFQNILWTGIWKCFLLFRNFAKNQSIVFVDLISENKINCSYFYMCFHSSIRGIKQLKLFHL